MEPATTEGFNLWSADNILWVGLGTVVTWLLKNERRLAKVMTREEHDKICMQRNESIGKALDEIKASLQRSSEQRDLLLTTIGDMRTDIGILKERTHK